MSHSLLRLAQMCFVAVGVLLISGCRSKLEKEYGTSEGFSARESPASVTVFRNLCDEQGSNSLTVRSLSPRARSKLGVIVWTPDMFPLHKPETFDWFDAWLADGDRILVYVGRDFSPMSDYWKQVTDEVLQNESNAEDTLLREYQALEDCQLETLRAHVRRIVATPWCMFDYEHSVMQRVDEFAGPWATGIDADRTRVFLRSFPVAYNPGSLAKLKSQFDRSAEDTSSKPTDDTEFSFKWQKNDIDMSSFVDDLSLDDFPEATLLLTTSDGTPLITEISKPKWGRSRVLIVSNASLLSNVSLINPGNLAIAKKIASQFNQNEVGFLTGSFDPPIRKDDRTEQQKGFEMLTIWPLNVITLHAIFIGMLMLLAIYPIFGRAKRLPQKSTRDFAQHVEAMGGLLYKSEDRFYALATIADYFKLVRKDPTSPWANVEPTIQQAPKSPFAKP